MATVGITKELMNRTSGVINRMRKAEIAADVPGHDKSFQVSATRLFHQGCWGAEHMHLVDAIPKDWLSPATNVEVTITGTIKDVDPVVDLEHKASIRFEGLVGAFSRPKDSYWNSSVCNLTIQDIEAMPSDTIGRSQCIERWRDSIEVRKIDVRWAKIDTDITDFLKKCKTLNEAVKLYPAVTMYIDPEDLERLNRKVERLSQRKKIVEGMATDELTAAAMAAKLSGAV